MKQINSHSDYVVAGIRYETKDGVFYTENQNDIWNSKEEIIRWSFLFEKVFHHKSDDCVSLSGSRNVEPK